MRSAKGRSCVSRSAVNVEQSGSRRPGSKRTYEGILVAAAQLEPELVVDLHRVGQMEGGQVEAVVATFIDDDLTRINLPLAMIARLAEDAEDGVLRMVPVDVGPEGGAALGEVAGVVK
jgi:hypothetical protein